MTSGTGGGDAWRWPTTAEELVVEQLALAAAATKALAADPFEPTGGPGLVGGCYLAFGREATAPMVPPDLVGRRAGPTPGFAAAVVWRLAELGTSGSRRSRRSDRMLAGSGPVGPRRARDVSDQVVVGGHAGGAYRPGLLALRAGPLLAEALAGLSVRPEVVLVDATGRDHPRRAGLAVHLGAVTGLPTVGVTDRPPVASGAPPGTARGATSPLELDGEEVARYLRTRSGVRPVIVHPGWRTDLAAAVTVVLGASTEGSRTPVPLAEARRVAREARAIAEGRSP